MLTLWDLLKPIVPAALRPQKPPAPRPAPPTRPAPAAKKPRPVRESALDNYERTARELLRAHDIRVRRWRKSMSGVAWRVRYTDGRVVRLIEAPRPRGPMSAAVFLHEIGHHVIGLGAYKPRCLEEYMAWRWALDEMQRRGLNITHAVRRRMHRSLWYAAQKATRRGLKQLPPELHQFAASPEPPRAANHNSITRRASKRK